MLELGQARSHRSEPAKREATSSGETPEPKRMLCLAWSVDDVCRYIIHLELGHVIEAFREADLISELGLKPLQARKVKDRLT